MILQLIAALLAQAAPADRSPATNNSENRAKAAPPTETQQLAQVPGRKATPRKQWKRGDRQARRQARLRPPPRPPEDPRKLHTGEPQQ